MNYYTIKPPPALCAYVRYFWVLEGDIAKGQEYIHRSMANSCPEMFFHYRGVFDEQRQPGQWSRSHASGLHGQSQFVSRFKITESFAMFGAYLYPYALSAFFGIPASALSNDIPDLRSLLGTEGSELEDKIMNAASNQQRADLLSAFFLQKLMKKTGEDSPVFSSINYILKTRGSVPIEQLSSQYFLSSRQFERKFKTFSGFTPKLYSRIVRFQSALGEYGQINKSLTDIAYECGYYDQSHFIHEFKEFSGHHPKTFFFGDAEGTEWREKT